MKLKRMLTIIKTIIGLLLAAGFILVFALFCSGRVGWFLLLALFLAPLISVLIASFFRKCIEVSLNVSTYSVEKGNHVGVQVVVTNRGLLPTPAVKVTFEKNYNFGGGEEALVFYVRPRGSSTFTSEYKALVSGGSEIRIKEVRVSDYFGLYSFGVDIKNSVCANMGIVPEILKQTEDNQVIRQSMIAAMDDGDNEDTIDETTLFFGGFPGYDYREYQPGDPLKRINTKLSAKQDKLMVRLDEKRVISSVNLILDPCSAPNKRINQEMYGELPAGEQEALISENVLETALGMIQAFVLKDFGVNVLVPTAYDFAEYSIVDESGIVMLSKELSNYKFASDLSVSRLPSDKVLSGRSAIVYCTPFLDNQLSASLAELKQKNNCNVNVYVASLTEGRAI